MGRELKFLIWLSAPRLVIFSSPGLMSSVLVWVPRETDPETRIPVGVVYLGGGPRKHDAKEGEERREEETGSKVVLI